MRRRLLSQLILVLALGAVVAPLANATGPYDGYKSSYPQLHQLHSGAQAGYDGYKSSYPQLHLVRSHQLTVPLVQATGRGFDWRDAAVGAGTAAVAILLIAGAALFLSRRRMRPSSGRAVPEGASGSVDDTWLDPQFTQSRDVFTIKTG